MPQMASNPYIPQKVVSVNSSYEEQQAVNVDTRVTSIFSDSKRQEEIT